MMFLLMQVYSMSLKAVIQSGKQIQCQCICLLFFFLFFFLSLYQLLKARVIACPHFLSFASIFQQLPNTTSSHQRLSVDFLIFLPSSLHHSFRELLPTIQPEPPLVQLKAIISHPRCCSEAPFYLMFYVGI